MGGAPRVEASLTLDLLAVFNRMPYNCYFLFFREGGVLEQWVGWPSFTDV